MASMNRLVMASLCAALAVAATSADAVRLGGGRSIGVKAKGNGIMNSAAKAEGTGIAAAAGPAKVETPLGRALTGADARESVVSGVNAAAARAAARNAAADSRADSPANTQAFNAAVAASVGTSPGAPSAAGAAGMAKAAKDAEPEHATDTMVLRMFDQSAEKAAQRLEKPAEKSAAAIALEKKQAEDKAAAARAEEERKVRLARVRSCRIEPVMTDAAIANCQKVLRETL